MNEQRANDGAGPFVRGRRQPHNLPDVWDDVFPDDQRSWKSYRKTRFKEVHVGTNHDKGGLV